MFRKISGWYMKQNMSHILLTMYFVAATTATFVIPGREGLVLWVWGTGASVIVGSWMWSLNRITKQSTGKNLWDNG